MNARVSRERKGQFEIFGMAIFIVIVILGVLLFVLLPDTNTEDASGTYENEQLSQNIVDTLLRTNAGPACVDQPDATIYDLVRDVTILRTGVCDGDVDTSATIIKEAANTAVQSATASKYDFTLWLLQEPDNPVVLDISNNPCPAGNRVTRERIGEQRIRLIPTPETAVLSLQLCPGAR